MLLFSALLAFAPRAAAVDGVVLIHQGTSVNGLPGCPHAGFPIEICHSGSYRLAGNLDASAVTFLGAIEITADNVTLDLNGFAVSGAAVCTPGTYPVQCATLGFGTGVFSFVRNTAVRNGTVRGFGSGVVLAGLGSVIEGVRAESNSDASVGAAGISVTNGIVTHCTSTANAGDGIRALPFETTVSLNTVSFNGGFGINGGGSVSNNSVSENGQDGIHNATSALYNTLFTNIGLGITDDSPEFGYLGNVMIGNRGGTVFGGQSLGHNLCNGIAC